MTMFGISVDEFFYPNMNADTACRKRIEILLNSMDEKDLPLVELLIKAVIDAKETEEA